MGLPGGTGWSLHGKQCQSEFPPLEEDDPRMTAQLFPVPLGHSAGFAGFDGFPYRAQLIYSPLSPPTFDRRGTS